MNTKCLVIIFFSLLCPQLFSCEQGHTTPLLLSHPRRSIRSLGDSSDTRVSISIDVFGESVTLHLVQNKDLLHANYTHQHIGANNHVVSQSGASALCHYTGHVECTSCEDTRAFVSTCHGELRGLFTFNKTDHFIEPNPGSEAATHIVYTQVADGETYSEVLHEQREWLGQATQSQLRAVRSSAPSNSRYYLESLVALDSSMVSYHGSVAESYALTIMNIVAGLLSQPSLGLSISLVVSRLVSTSAGPDTFEWNTNEPSRSLHNFCEWQHSINGTHGDPTHDLALLFTRRSLCRSNCFVVGRAFLEGMCQGRYSCLMVRDKGLVQGGTTVAHEMGHLLGSYHDENPHKCGAFGVPATPSIMSQVLTSRTNHFEWSACARHSIADFLSRGRDSCLLNNPTNQIHRPTLQLSADEQCESALGASARAVSSRTACDALACHQTQNPNRWITLPMPMQDGTACSINSNTAGQCLRGVCVPREESGCSGDLPGQGGLDECGVCHGDGTSCHIVSGTISKLVPSFELFHFLSIPRGARGVKLIYLAPSSHVHLVLTQAGEFELLQPNRDLTIYGVAWESATLPNGSYTFSTSGHISNPLELKVLGDSTLVALYYLYASPRISEASEEAYRWRAASLCHSCSATCGSAVRECVAQCVDANGLPVSPQLCDSSTKPPDSSSPCRDLPSCTSYTWASSGWGPCSAACGRGLKTRSTLCLAKVGSSYQVAHESNCVAGERPKSSLPCWQSCSTTVPPSQPAT